MNGTAHTPLPASTFDSPVRKLGVVVGFDGSENATRALHYAARAAQRRQAVLTVVSAFTVPVAVYPNLASLPEVSEDDVKRHIAETALEAAREYLTEHTGEVTYRAERGDAAGVMVELSRQAQLMVVGARGRGGFLGRVLGSVASALPAHGYCPTVVVPRDYAAGEASTSEAFSPVDVDAAVVVGIDGSAHSRSAALLAAQAAAERGTSLRMVLALPPLDGALIWYPELAPHAEGRVEQRRAQLQEELDSEAEVIRARFPELSVIPSVEIGEAPAVLHRATRSAQLTVVGTRGQGAFKSALMGSVSRALLLQAEGPVMVVPQMEEGPGRHQAV